MLVLYGFLTNLVKTGCSKRFVKQRLTESRVF